MKKLALVGCGQISSRHFGHAEQVGEVVAVCDVVRERADAAAGQHKAKAYYAIDDLLAAEHAVELVIVCTPNGLHAEHIIKSLQAGKHVLTEKPLCLTAAAAWQMIETEKFTRRKIFLVQSAPYNPLLQQLAKAIAGGKLGRLYSFVLNCNWQRPDAYFTDWRGKFFPDGGLLYNQFSHSLDALLALFGEVEEAKGFVATQAHRNMEFEDCGAVALQTKNGAVGTLHWSVNAFEKNHEIGLTIVAEKATVGIGGEYLNEVSYVKAAEDLSLKSFSRNEVDFHAAMYAHLAKALNGDTGFPSAFDGLRTVETVEKIYKAVR